MANHFDGYTAAMLTKEARLAIRSLAKSEGERIKYLK